MADWCKRWRSWSRETSGTITAAVDRQDLSAPAEKLVMLRHTDDGWTVLETRVVSSTDDGSQPTGVEGIVLVSTLVAVLAAGFLFFRRQGDE